MSEVVVKVIQYNPESPRFTYTEVEIDGRFCGFLCPHDNEPVSLTIERIVKALLGVDNVKIERSKN